MSEHQESMTPEQAAAAKGLVVVIPKPNELFIDIDDEPSLAIFNRNIVRLADMKHWTKNPSPSGASGRFHITVTLKRPVKDAFERIMLQALLGSDRIHESLSWVSACKGDREPTVFFERPKAKEEAAE